MTKKKAIEVLQSHKSHWERLVRNKICGKKEGTEFINAVDMAITALKNESEEEETIKKDTYPCYTCTLDCDTTCEIYKRWLQNAKESEETE